jgi:DNA-directed RNA polymerase subunit K/omega
MPAHKHATKFERTRIISARALQIAQGSPILVKTSKDVIEPIEIAKLEWDAGVVPIDIKKPTRDDK